MNKKRTALLLSLIATALPSFAAEDAAKTLYTQKCASCHAKDGKGNPAMAKMFKLDPAALDLTSKTTLEKKDDELILTTTKGHGKMPAYETKLKAEEIKGLVAFIRSLSKPK
jgi:mono/diheme cytochrome c family protein